MPRLERWCLEWGRNEKTPEGWYWYYVNLRPNWLEPKNRHVGFMRLWYDGPHVAFGFWWFNVGWTTRWSLPPPEFLTDEARLRWRKKPLWWKKLWGMEEYDPAQAIRP